MMYSSKPGGPGTWPKRLMAVFGSVMLVLSLIPTPGLAEALTELGVVNDGDIDVVDDVPEEESAEVLTLQEDEQIVGSDQAEDDDEAVVATTQIDDTNPYELSTESVPHEKSDGVSVAYDAVNLQITWKVLFTVPVSGMQRFTLTDILPNTTANGKTYRDHLLESASIDITGYPDVSLTGIDSGSIKDDKDAVENISNMEYNVTETESGFTIDFIDGLPAASKPYAVQVIVYTQVDQDWYSDSGASREHINTVQLLPRTYTTPFTATSNAIEVTPTNCKHNDLTYTYANSKSHKVACANPDCDYFRFEEHRIEVKDNTIACKDCGTEGVRVSFSNGGGSGNMDNEYYAKGYEYILPSCAGKMTGPNGKSFYYWEVKVGDSAAVSKYPNDAIKVTNNTTIKAIWSDSITYMDDQQTPVEKTRVGYSAISSTTKKLEDNWYVVKGSVNLGDKTLEVAGDAKLILCDGAKLTTAGIEIGALKSLTIYGQKNDSGSIACANSGKVAITNNGTLTIYGGIVSSGTQAGILNNGQCVIAGGNISSIVFDELPNGAIQVKRKPKFNVHLPRSKYIEVSGKLVAGASISVSLPIPTSRVFTRNYGTIMGNADPSAYFTCNNEPLIINKTLVKNEVQVWDPYAFYVDENGTKHDIDSYTPISSIIDTDGNPTQPLKKDWYTVDKSTTFKSRLSVEGNAKLVLVDGTTLTCEEGICIKNGSLSIYAQQTGSESTVGKLIAQYPSNESTTTTNAEGEVILGTPYAAIGGNEGDNTTLNIYGGVITATGTTSGAGIGGGGDGGDGGTINIYGGKVVATGGDNAAGIGGGGYRKESNDGAGGNITIYGGEVEANGGSYAAGIGGGKSGRMGNVVIHGGTVTANGGKFAAGIGSGKGQKADGTFTAKGGTITANGGEFGAGIGGGSEGDGATVDISGTAVVVANGGKEAAGIGGGDKAVSGSVTIDGDSCSVHVQGDETAQGIGNGSEALDRNPGELILADGSALWASTDGVNHVLMDQRVSTMRSSTAYLDPCEHTGEGTHFTYTTEGHNIVCPYCDTEHSVPEPHKYNADGVCTVCGAKSGIIQFNKNGGIGNIKDDRYVIGCDYTLPQCTKSEIEPPIVGTKFLYWEIDGKAYLAGEKVQFDSGKVVTAKAIWSETVLYWNQTGEKLIGTANYRVLNADETEWNNDWYVALGDGNVTIQNRVVVTGNVSLVLRDDATITLNNELYVSPKATLNIYWQENKSGKLYGPEDSEGGIVDDNNGFIWVGAGGTLNLYGGNIHAFTCVDNDGIFNMYDGNVSSTGWSVSNNDANAKSDIYGGTITGGEWGVSITGGKVGMHGGTITGTNEGVEILAGLSGEFSMDGGTIENSQSYGIRQEGSTTLCIAGKPTFANNSKCDIMLEDGAYISTGTLDDGFAAVVALEKEKGTFTNGFEINNENLDPAQVFSAASSDLTVSLKDGEAVIGSSGRIQYYDENEEEYICEEYRKLNNDVLKIQNNLAYLEPGWYLATGNFTVDKTLVIQGGVNIILDDGACITANNGVRVEKGSGTSTFEVWGAKNGNGKFVVNTNNTASQAGIGSSGNGKPGNVIIHRGEVKVTGGKSSAGIECASGNTVKIMGGNVTVTAGRGFTAGAAIGCASTYESGNFVIGDHQCVLVNGSLVTASERVAACGNSEVQIKECVHENKSYETTPETHRLVCNNCLLGDEAEDHSFNAEGVCDVCGYEDMVTITFMPGDSGTGTMEPVEVPRNKPTPMPSCAYTNADGKAFVGWQIGNEVIDAEVDYTATNNVTATALWGNGFKLFATSRTVDKPATVVDITMSPSKTMYAADSVVTITAPAKKGYEFQGWYEATAIDDDQQVIEYGSEVLCNKLVYELTVTKEMNICAVYKPTETVAVVVYGAGGQVSVNNSKATDRWSKRINKGDTITMVAADPSKAKQWVDGKSNKILATTPEFTLTIIDATNITLMYNSESDGENSYVQWISDFKQVLASENYDTETDIEDIANTVTEISKPSKYGYTFNRWVFLGPDGKKTDVEATPQAIKDRIGIEANIDIAPDYIRLDTKYSITVRYINAEGKEIRKSVSGSGLMGNFVSVNAPNVSGYLFKCWMNDDNTVLAYTKGYKVQYSRNKEVYACYVKTAEEVPEAIPVIYLRRLFQDSAAEGQYDFRASVTITMPQANWEYINSGILYQTDFYNANENNFVFGARGVDYTRFADLTTEVGMGQIVCSSGDPDEVWTCRGYLIARNKTDGKIYYFYSNIREASYNDLNTI